MRKNWELFGSGTRVRTANFFAVASLFAVPSLFASDDPPETKKDMEVQVIVNGSGIGDALELVRKALEDSKIPVAERAKILEQLRSSIDQAKSVNDSVSAAKQLKLKKLLSRSQSKSDASEPSDPANENENTVEITVDNEGNGSARTLFFNNGTFSTKLVSPLTKQGDAYRIGLALEQISTHDENSDATDDQATVEATDEAAKVKKGVVVLSTMADSPAEKMGIKKGDVIVSANGKEIVVYRDLMVLIQEAGKSEKPLQLAIEREGELLKVEVKPSKMKAADVAMETIELSMPSGGFLLDSSEMVERFKDAEAVRNAQRNPSLRLAELKGGELSQLSKEVTELKEEISELKKLIKQLAEKK